METTKVDTSACSSIHSVCSPASLLCEQTRPSAVSGQVVMLVKKRYRMVQNSKGRNEFALKKESRQLSPMRKQKCQFAVSCLSIRSRQQLAKKKECLMSGARMGNKTFLFLLFFKGDDVNWRIRVENMRRDEILKTMNIHNYTLRTSIFCRWE